MQVYELPPEDQAWLHESVLVFNRSKDKEFRGVYAKKNYILAPMTMTTFPRSALICWAGNPRLRKDSVMWHREVSRLKGAIGEGTGHFDYWLGQGHLAVPDFQNHKEGYYQTPGQEVKWETVGQPIPQSYFEMPDLPSQPIITGFSDADFDKFDAMVRGQVGGNRPVEAVGEAYGGELSEDEELGMAINATRMNSSGVVRSRVA